jgi:hypothetical protein
MGEFYFFLRIFIFFILATAVRTTSGKIPKIVATYIYASSQGQRTHSAPTNF